MSDFSASIKAVLDISGIPKQITELQNQLNKIGSIKITLGDGKNTLNVTALNNEIKNSLSKTGTNAGQAFAQSLNSSLNNIHLRNGGLGNIKNMLQGVGFNSKSIDIATQSIDKMVVSVAKLNTTQLKNGNIRIKINGIDEVGRAVNIVRDFDKETGRVVNTTKSFSQSFDNAGKAAETLLKSKTTSNDIGSWLKNNGKAADRFGEELRELQQQLNNNSDPTVLKNVKLKFAEIKSEAKALGLTTNTFLTNLKNIGAQLLGLTSTVAIIQKAIEIAEKMYQNVYEIDTAMTNLKKVTDESDTVYSKFFSRTADSAKNLGKTISGLITQTSEWAKLGYSLTESEELSKLSSIYANVGEIDDKTAVSDMVTALKAYNIDTDDAAKIIDIYNELGNKFAISSAKLGEGISKSASALSLAGASIEQSSAMLTGIAEITQNAPEAGNALKIFTMRIRGMKGELEELGEEVDPTVDSISKVQTQILNLTKGKVNIFDSTGSFRNYYDIMKEIADIYDELSSTDKASLLEILFGKQRGNAGSALIQAFQSGQVEKAYDAALNSKDSAYMEQIKWMDSLEAKTSQLKASWENLSAVAMDSDFLKNIVDAGTTLLNVLSSIIEEFGMFKVSIAGIGLAALIKNFDWLMRAITYPRICLVYYGRRIIIMAMIIIP